MGKKFCFLKTRRNSLAEFRLIQLGRGKFVNGRIYDSHLGRFLSADPIVQAPGDLQSYNRYSYVRNNPLTLTDPSGYSWWGDHVTQWGRDYLKGNGAAEDQPQRQRLPFRYASLPLLRASLTSCHTLRSRKPSLHLTPRLSTYKFL